MKTHSVLPIVLLFLSGNMAPFTACGSPEVVGIPSNHTIESRWSENHIRVFGNSMNPTLFHNQILEVDYTFPFKKLKHGDIVLYSCERGFQVVHRIRQRVDYGRWVIKGDNNPTDDSTTLSPQNFLGKVNVSDS